MVDVILDQCQLLSALPVMLSTESPGLNPCLIHQCSGTTGAYRQWNSLALLRTAGPDTTACAPPGRSHTPPGLRFEYSSSSRAGRLGRTLWPQNSTSVAETEKGGQNSTITPPRLEKGGQYSTSVWKVCKKGGQKSPILKNIGVKILQVWKWGVKILHAEK